MHHEVLQFFVFPLQTSVCQLCDYRVPNQSVANFSPRDSEKDHVTSLLQCVEEQATHKQGVVTGVVTLFKTQWRQCPKYKGVHGNN